MPRCKHCKEKFVTRYFNQKHCLSKDECIKAHSEMVKANNWKKEKKKLKQDLMRKQDYEKALQVLVNKYVRLRDVDKPCVSCGIALVGKFDAGHYYPAGSYKNVRFNTDNIHGQCVACNQHKHGNLINYTDRLPFRIGGKRFKELKHQSQIERHYTIPELKELIDKYKLKIKLWK